MTASSSSLVRPAAVAMAVDTVGVLPIFLTGALAVQLRDDIGLSVDLLGLVYASYFTAAALFSAPLSHVSDRTGPEWALRIGTVVYIVSFLGLATLVTSSDHPVAFIALAGLGTALTRTASSVLIARNVNPKRHGLAFGLKHSSIPIGTLLAGLSVPAIALTVGWHWAYAAAALLSLVVLFAIPKPSGRVDRKSEIGSRGYVASLVDFLGRGFRTRQFSGRVPGCIHREHSRCLGNERGWGRHPRRDRKRGGTREPHLSWVVGRIGAAEASWIS